MKRRRDFQLAMIFGRSWREREQKVKKRTTSWQVKKRKREQINSRKGAAGWSRKEDRKQKKKEKRKRIVLALSSKVSKRRGRGEFLGLFRWTIFEPKR